MSRLIDADKLIEELEKMIHPMSTPDGAGIHDMEINAYDEAIVDVMRTIDEQPTANDWIPADNPPEPEEYILLSFENFSVPVVGMYREDEGGGAYYVGDDDEACSSHGLFVNAWQPLQKPYKGGAE